MSIAIQFDDATLFERIKNGEHHLIDELYRRHRESFLSYARNRLSANDEDAVDCFQEAVIVFYKNVVSGHLSELNCSISTYLFAVGKRLVYKRNTDRRRESPIDLGDDRQYADELDLSLFERIDNDHRRAAMVAALSQLGEVCQKLLTLFYYHRYATESVQAELGLSSPGAVRIKKMRCLNELKAAYNDKR